ncbi:ESCRT-II complex, vps25 subunit, partial [Wilcoxina mikolae CBS 423.85]
MSTTTTTTSIFPPLYSFPPFFTRQPNAATWAAQRTAWCSFILTYCRSHKQWRFQLSSALETDLFYNSTLNRRLKQQDVVEVLEAMVTEGTIEWADKERSSVIVYWRKPEEWAGVIADWIDATGQKGSVLTLYEISWGDLTTGQEFHGIDPTVLRKALDVLVERGAAKVFGSGEE